MKGFKRKHADKWMAVILVTVIAVFASKIALAYITGRVVSVTDGDTIKVLDASNTQYKIRLSGIDAPERGQPYGTASRNYLAGLVAGKTVTVETTKTDQYGRQIGKVLVDGVDANLEQVKAGMAWWYRYYKAEQPRADRKDYEAAEDYAKVERRGLWADPNPISPYEWRKGKR